MRIALGIIRGCLRQRVPTSCRSMMMASGKPWRRSAADPRGVWRRDVNSTERGRVEVFGSLVVNFESAQDHRESCGNRCSSVSGRAAVHAVMQRRSRIQDQDMPRMLDRDCAPHSATPSRPHRAPARDRTLRLYGACGCSLSLNARLPRKASMIRRDGLFAISQVARSRHRQVIHGVDYAGV